MRFHFQGIDEMFLHSIFHEIIGETLMAILMDHRHHLFWVTQSCRPFNVGNDLRIKSTVSHPAYFGTLHGVPESDTEQIVAPGLGIVRESFGEGPSADILKSGRLESCEGKRSDKREICGSTPFDGNYVFELFYNFQVTDNIKVTPAIFYLSRPMGQYTNNLVENGQGYDGQFNVFGGLIQTTFKF